MKSSDHCNRLLLRHLKNALEFRQASERLSSDNKTVGFICFEITARWLKVGMIQATQYVCKAQQKLFFLMTRKLSDNEQGRIKTLGGQNETAHNKVCGLS